MEEVKNSITECIPDIENVILEDMLAKLKEDGADSIKMCTFVQEQDIIEFLPKMKCRMLLQHWCKVNPPISESSTKEANLVKDWEHVFEIPYDAICPQVFKKMRDGFPLNLPERKKLVNAVVIKARSYENRPSKKKMTVIARRIFEDYRSSIIDTISGEMVGCGYVSFLQQLVNKVDNLARGSTNAMKRKDYSSDDSSSSISQDYYGCNNSRPQIVPATKASMVSIKAEMVVETTKIKIIEGMKDAYPLLREEINVMNENLKCKPSESTMNITMSNIGSILKEWPGMRFYEAIMDHFHKLTGIQLHDKMTEGFMEYGKAIVIHSATLKHNVKHHSISEEVAKSKLILDSNEPLLTGVFLHLTVLLNEDIKGFVLQLEVSYFIVINIFLLVLGYS